MRLIIDPQLRENTSDAVKKQVAFIKEQPVRDIDCFFTQAGNPHDTGLLNHFSRDILLKRCGRAMNSTPPHLVNFCPYFTIFHYRRCRFYD
ncbi:unnamed protein product [Dicrocoelium dendriticum]|nr:unnamed protein product [Dicrocoelium dendriticum]